MPTLMTVLMSVGVVILGIVALVLVLLVVGQSGDGASVGGTRDPGLPPAKAKPPDGWRVIGGLGRTTIERIPHGGDDRA